MRRRASIRDRYARVMALNDYLFNDLRFVGNSTNYEDPRNSCLNEVLDRRTGIPITLALLYIEVARRAGLDVQGVNFPGHFLLRCPAGRNEPYSADLIIDAFHGGALLSADACQELLRRHQSSPDEDTFESRAFSRATKPQILSRMLLNLKRIYERMHSFPQARDVTELLLAVDPTVTDRTARPWPPRVPRQGLLGGAARSRGVSAMPGAPADGRRRTPGERTDLGAREDAPPPSCDAELAGRCRDWPRPLRVPSFSLGTFVKQRTDATVRVRFGARGGAVVVEIQNARR